MEKNNNITGNFGNLTISKQNSNTPNHNYSALKRAAIDEAESTKTPQ